MSHIFNGKENLITVKTMLETVMNTRLAINNVFLGEITDPEAQPLVWVSKWVDYSERYGFGFQLSDVAVGVKFNDCSEMLMLKNGSTKVRYIERDVEVSYFTLKNCPLELRTKTTIYSYFTRYMHNLTMTKASMVQETENLSRMPYLYTWCRFTLGLFMQLSNGTVQINFQDHGKIIICPVMGAITYVDDDKHFRTFRFTTLEKDGCNGELLEKMEFAHEMIEQFLDPSNDPLPYS